MGEDGALALRSLGPSQEERAGGQSKSQLLGRTRGEVEVEHGR